MACTVHKVQGLSLTEGEAIFVLESQKSFSPGQIYIALSRITSIHELYLIRKYTTAALKVNESAKKEYEKLRTESASTISLLNTRSFKTHFRDFLLEKHLLENDISCLTETQLKINADTYIME